MHLIQSTKHCLPAAVYIPTSHKVRTSLLPVPMVTVTYLPMIGLVQVWDFVPPSVWAPAKWAHSCGEKETVLSCWINRPLAQFSQCTSPTSHYTPVSNRMCTFYVCIFLLQNGKLWDICLMRGIREMSLLNRRPKRIYEKWSSSVLIKIRRKFWNSPTQLTQVRVTHII